MKKQSLFRKLWLPAVMASVGIAILCTQINFGFFQHNPSHDQAVLRYYYIYDTNGNAVAKVTLYVDGCKETDPMGPGPTIIEAPMVAVVSLYAPSDRFVGKWVYNSDKTKDWYRFNDDTEGRLLAFSSHHTDELLAVVNKRRPTETIFQL